MPTLDADVYSFDDDDHEFLDFLKESGVAGVIDKSADDALKQGLRQDALHDAREALSELSEMPINKALVEAKARVGRVYFNLHKLLYESAVLTIHALLLIKFMGAPAKSAVPSAVKSAIEVIRSIRLLDDEELNVYKGVVQVIKDKGTIIFKQPGASVTETQAWFERNELMSGDVPTLLKQMKEKKILVEKTGVDGVTYYFPNEEWKS